MTSSFDVSHGKFENNSNNFPEKRKVHPEKNKFQLWLRQLRYSPNTIKTYSECLNTCLLRIGKEPRQITNEDVFDFMEEYIFANNFSFSYQNQFINAIKLYFKDLQDKKLELQKLKRPRSGKQLPKVLDKEEIRKILAAPSNIKHRALLATVYGCGLRRSEVLGLRPEHINSTNMTIQIIGAKGNKDRIVFLPPKVLSLLRDYYRSCSPKPKVWLFEGPNPGSKYSASSLQAIFKRAVKKAGIKKQVTLHCLRHSFATHLMESSTGIRYIQELLGHKSTKTTEIYTHVSNHAITKIRSPIEDL